MLSASTKLYSPAVPSRSQGQISLVTLLLSFQTRRLSAVRMAEDNLEMGKGSVPDCGTDLRLIKTDLAVTDQD